jgi:hypothetical protein
MGLYPVQLNWLPTLPRTTWLLLVSKRPSYLLHPPPPSYPDTPWSAGTALEVTVAVSSSLSTMMSLTSGKKFVPFYVVTPP